MKVVGADASTVKVVDMNFEDGTVPLDNEDKGKFSLKKSEFKKKIKLSFLYSNLFINLKLLFVNFISAKLNKILNKQYIPDNKNIIYLEPSSKCNLKCKFCGYQGEQLEVVNLDGDYGNNPIHNLVTACNFCMQPQLLDSYKIDYEGEDKMIFLPDIHQEQLSFFYRSLYYSISQGGDAAYNAKMLYAQLKDQATFLDEQVGLELSNPSHFVFYLKSEDPDLELINKIRWLPHIDVKANADFVKNLEEEFSILKRYENL